MDTIILNGSRTTTLFDRATAIAKPWLTVSWAMKPSAKRQYTNSSFTAHFFAKCWIPRVDSCLVVTLSG
jgi:hypothetical protein